MARVAINGLGRIGRATLKILMQTPGLDLVAVNDIGMLDNLAYLIQYDSVYGPYDRCVKINDGKLVVDGKAIVYISERDPEKLPWGDHHVDLVFECTGLFTKQEQAQKHLLAGAGRVIISGPTSSVETPTVVYGVNDEIQTPSVISVASCTTNNVTPVIEIMHRHFGVAKALMTTVSRVHGNADAGRRARRQKGRATWTRCRLQHCAIIYRGRHCNHKSATGIHRPF